MRTAKEVIDFIDVKLKQKEMTRAELLHRTGLSRSLIIQSLKRNSYMRLENLRDIAEELALPLGELLGLSHSEMVVVLPDDIQAIVDMLMVIPEESRVHIRTLAESYYTTVVREKKEAGATAG